MFPLVMRLGITIIQLGLVNYIFSNIQFGTSKKANEKQALKNFLHGFLLYIIGFSAIISIVSMLIKFPKRLQMPIFFGGFLLLTLVWVVENRNLILENIKHTMLGKLMTKQATIIKETMTTNTNIQPNMCDKYPFHCYEPISPFGKKTVTEYKLQKQPAGAKMILQSKN